MNYIKCLVFNFLVVFFANYILPGIHVSDLTKLPHVRADLLLPLFLGLINSLIYPTLRVFDRSISWFHIAALALVINFVAYAIIKILPIGIEIVTLEGYLCVSIVVSVGSFIMNYWEMRYCLRVSKHDEPGMPE